MTIPTLKNKHIATILGTGTAYMLEDMLRAGRSIITIAAAMGTSEAHLQNLLNGPDPLPEMPINWTPQSTAGVAPYCAPQYVGITPTPWGGIEGGYTYGPPIFDGSVYSVAAYPTPAPRYLPRNWTPFNVVGVLPYCAPEFVGIAPIPYTAGPEGGFTYGPAVY